MSTKNKRAIIPKATGQTQFYSSLDALEKVVKVAVDGVTPDVNLLSQVDYYLSTLQDGADLVNVVLYQHNVTKLLQIMQGIGTLHELMLDKTKLKAAVEADKDYAVKLLSTLYKEGGATLAFMDSKGSKLFDTDGLKKSPMIAQSGASADMGKKLLKLPSSKRDELRGIVSKLLRSNTNGTSQPVSPRIKRRSSKKARIVEVPAGDPAS